MFNAALKTAPLAVLIALLPLAAAASPKPTAIKKAFKSGDADTVKAMLKELHGNLDKKAVSTVLKNALKLQELGVYNELLEALRTAEGDALAELVKAYKKEKKGQMRFLVVDALGTIQQKVAEDTLVTAIEKDKDPAVRVQSVRLMGKRFTATAVDALIPLLAKFESDEKEDRLVREIKASLGNLTGEDGLLLAEDWENFWASRRDDYTKPKPEDEKTTKTRGGVMERMKRERPAEM